VEVKHKICSAIATPSLRKFIT